MNKGLTYRLGVKYFFCILIKAGHVCNGGCFDAGEKYCKGKCADHGSYFSCQSKCSLSNGVEGDPLSCIRNPDCAKKCEMECNKFWPGGKITRNLFYRKSEFYCYYDLW